MQRLATELGPVGRCPAPGAATEEKGKTMKRWLAFAALAAACLCAAPVLAQSEKTCPKAKTCPTAKTCQTKGESKAPAESEAKDSAAPAAAEHEHGKTTMCVSDVTCDGDVVRHEGIDLPRIGFKVGETITCCMKSATQMAGGDLKKIKFVVGEKTYDDLDAAQAARLDMLEKHYENLVTVSYAVGDERTSCPMAAQELAKKQGKPVRYRLGAFDFAEQADAAKVSEAARAAGDKLAMKWAVGDKTFDSAADAAEAAKASGQSVEYVVAEQKTPCEVTAQTRLIEARISAALDVLAKVTKT